MINSSDSLKASLLKYLKAEYPARVHKGELEKVGQALGYEAETAARRLRDLRKEGKIDILKMDSKNTFYIYRDETEDTGTRYPKVNPRLPEGEADISLSPKFGSDDKQLQGELSLYEIRSRW